MSIVSATRARYPGVMETTPRPGAPRVLGILSIVFGSIVVAFSVFGLAAAGMGRDMMGFRGAREAFDAYSAALQPWASIATIVMVGMSLALLFIGIGQRGYRQWAQRASVVWAALALVVLAGQFAFHFLVTAPALDQFIASLQRHSPVSDMMSGMGAGLGFASLFFYAPYPIILLVLMRKPAVVAAMNE